MPEPKYDKNRQFWPVHYHIKCNKIRVLSKNCNKEKFLATLNIKVHPKVDHDVSFLIRASNHHFNDAQWSGKVQKCPKMTCSQHRQYGCRFYAKSDPKASADGLFLIRALYDQLGVHSGPKWSKNVRKIFFLRFWRNFAW